MSPMSYQGMKLTHHNNIMVYRCHQPWWSLRHDKGVSNDGNDQKNKNWRISKHKKSIKFVTNILLLLSKYMFDSGQNNFKLRTREKKQNQKHK